MSSSKLNNPTNSRDYGATRSRSDSNLPDVNFSGFSPTEVLSLSEDIASNIIAINRNVKNLERMAKDIGTRNDHQYKRDEMTNFIDHSNRCIDTTSADLKRLAAVVSRSDKQQKLQFEKLTKDFRATCDKYAKTQRHIVNVLRQSISVLKSHESDDVQEIAADGATQVQATQMQERELEMITEYSNNITQIESDMVQLSKLMDVFSNEVHAQGAQVLLVEENIENVALNVEQGRSELQKASTQRQSSRRRILILLIIAVIVGLIVTGIIVAKLK